MRENDQAVEQRESHNGENSSRRNRSENVRVFWDGLVTLLLAGSLYLGINAVSERIRVEGISMLPSLQPGEFVVVNRLAYQLGDPRRGDVIVFRFPRDPHQEFIKRVVGLPGDKVTVGRGEVRINDQLIEEPYIAAPPGYDGEWIVPQGAVFVLGDNRNNSSDSHHWGAVSVEAIIGKAVFVYWPPQRWGRIEGYSIAHVGD